MRFRKREPLFSILLGTGLHLLDSFREHLPDNVDDFLKIESGTRTTRIPTALSAQQTLFKARTIRTYSAKSVLC
jgi:hypothetical protein